MAEIDTKAPLAVNKADLQEVGRQARGRAGACLTTLGGGEFALAQAIGALEDLIALKGWQNLLGPRFEV